MRRVLALSVLLSMSGGCQERPPARPLADGGATGASAPATQERPAGATAPLSVDARLALVLSRLGAFKDLHLQGPCLTVLQSSGRGQTCYLGEPLRCLPWSAADGARADRSPVETAVCRDALARSALPPATRDVPPVAEALLGLPEVVRIRAYPGEAPYPVLAIGLLPAGGRDRESVVSDVGLAEFQNLGDKYLAFFAEGGWRLSEAPVPAVPKQGDVIDTRGLTGARRSIGVLLEQGWPQWEVDFVVFDLEHERPRVLVSKRVGMGIARSVSSSDVHGRIETRRGPRISTASPVCSVELRPGIDERGRVQLQVSELSIARGREQACASLRAFAREQQGLYCLQGDSLVRCEPGTPRGQ